MSQGYGPTPPPAPGLYGGGSGGESQRQKKLRQAIIIAAVAVVLLIALFVGGLVAIIFGALRSSEPYQYAVRTATTDPRVVAELGAPVKPGWLFSGSIQTSGASGRADLAINLHGSRLKGTLYVVAKKSTGRWSYQTLSLRAEGEPDLDLRQPPDGLPQVK